MKQDGSRLLIQESPLQVLPSLAVAIGLNEALFLQQLHYWLQSSQHVFEDRSWVYNTMDEWRKQLPFWSLSTLRRTVDELRNRKVIITGNFNSSSIDRKLWYSIDYDALDSLVSPFVENDIPFVQNEQMDMPNLDVPFVQNEQMHLVKMSRPFVQDEQMLIEQETTTETTQETNTIDSREAPKRKKRETPAEPHDTPKRDLIAAYCEELGYSPKVMGPILGAAKALHALTPPCLPDELRDAYRYYKQQPFWRDKQLTLMYLAKNLPEWRSRQRATEPVSTKSPEREALEREQAESRVRALYKSQGPEFYEKYLRDREQYEQSLRDGKLY